MIGPVLSEAAKANIKPKPATITTPKGYKLKWTKATDPTEEDWARLKEWDDAQPYNSAGVGADAGANAPLIEKRNSRFVSNAELEESLKGKTPKERDRLLKTNANLSGALQGANLAEAMAIQKKGDYDPVQKYIHTTGREFFNRINDVVGNVIGGSAMFGALGDYQARTLPPKEREKAFTEQGREVAQFVSPLETAQAATEDNPLAVAAILGVPAAISKGFKGFKGLLKGEAPKRPVSVHPPAETPKVAEATPKSAPKPPKTPTAGGLSRASRTVLADALGTNKPTTIGGKKLATLYEEGREQIAKGFDADDELEFLATSGKPASDEQIGIFTARREQLIGDLNRLTAKLDKGGSPTDIAKVIEERDKLFEKIAQWDRNLDEVKGSAGRALSSLRIGQTVNWNDLDEVLLEARRVKGTQISSGTEKQLAALNTKLQEAEGRLATKEAETVRARAEGRVSGVRSTEGRFSKADLDKELEDLFEAGKKALSKTASGIDPELFSIAGKIALNYAKRGVNTLDEVVASVQKAWKEKFGQDIDSQDVIDALGAKAEGAKRSDLEKQIAQLRAQAGRESTSGKKSIQGQIDELKEKLARGEYVSPTKRELQMSKEVEALRAEKSLYQGKMQALVRQQALPAGKKFLKATAANVRGTVLGSDIGVLTRQGLFGLSRPVAFAKGVGKGLKSSLSEKNLATVERHILEHDVAGQTAGVVYKKHGLSLTDHLLNPEELVVGYWMKKIPVLGKLSGSLERFQSAFINTLRSETMDRAIKLGYKENELRARANFINSATGRGNVNRVPEWLEVVMTSPRYEKSRWEMLFQPVRNLGVIGKDIVTGKGVNRGALDNLQDMAVTAAEVYGLYKLAEGSGYSVNFDPTSSDFLKMRMGDEVWDPSAGIAPRMRDLMRLIAWGAKPEYHQNALKVVGQGVIRPISPAIRQPVEIASQDAQRRLGVSEDKMASFFTGWKIDEDEKGWKTLLPLVWQTAKKYLDEGDAKGALSAGAREFVGQSINKYPPPKAK